MDYNLNIEHKTSTKAALRKMLQFMKEEKRNLVIAFIVMALNSGIAMLTPYLIGYTIDHYIQTKMYRGLNDLFRHFTRAFSHLCGDRLYANKDHGKHRSKNVV